MMGYYSNFQLTSVAGTPIDNIPDFPSYFEEITDYAFNEDLCDIKWYDVEGNMITISTQYPDTVFRLSWQGENFDDQGIA